MENTRVRSITKRDGRVVLYDESKIANAILKALAASGQEDAALAARLANQVGDALLCNRRGQLQNRTDSGRSGTCADA